MSIEKLESSVIEFKRGKLDPQALVAVGELTAIISTVRELGAQQQVDLGVFDTGDPETLLDYVLERGGQDVPTDKKTGRSKVHIFPNDKNKNVAKEFFKTYKTSADDPYSMIILPSLDSYFGTFGVFFEVLGAVVKELRKKKIRVLLILHFSDWPELKRFSKDLDKIQAIDFRAGQASGPSPALRQKSFPASATKSAEPEPVTLEMVQKTPDQPSTPPVIHVESKIPELGPMFTERSVPRATEAPKNLEMVITNFNTIVQQLVAEPAHNPPNGVLINQLQQLIPQLAYSEGLVLNPLIPPLEKLVNRYLSDPKWLNSAFPLVNVLYYLYRIKGEKLVRYELVKKAGDVFRKNSQLLYAAELGSIALAISGDASDAELVLEVYGQLASQTKESFLKRVYLYKASAAARISGDSSQHRSLLEQAQKTYSYTSHSTVFVSDSS